MRGMSDKLKPDWFLEYAPKKGDNWFNEVKPKLNSVISQKKLKRASAPSSQVAKFMTVKEVADYIRCNQSHVYDLINRGDLEYQPIGRKKLIAFHSLQAFLDTEKKRRCG